MSRTVADGEGGLPVKIVSAETLSRAAAFPQSMAALYRAKMMAVGGARIEAFAPPSLGGGGHLLSVSQTARVSAP